MHETSHNTSQPTCEACRVQRKRAPAAVVVNALWASGSATGAPMPLCWQHFWHWRRKLQPVMAGVLAHEPDAWIDTTQQLWDGTVFASPDSP